MLSFKVSFSQGNSLLWRISGNELAHPSYLYGTMHSPDPRVFHFADSVWSAFERCNAFAMEVVIDDSAQGSILENIFMNGNTTIRSLLTIPQYDSLQRFAIRNASIEISDFDRMKPLYVAMMLEMLAGGDSFVNSSDPFLDQYLENTARGQHKYVAGLETAGEQMAVFDAMSYTDQAKLLMKTVRDYSADTTEYERMVQYYLSNDLAMMMAFENDMGIPDSLYEALITQRNIRMAARIDTMVQRRSCFIAVGAGHLGGEGGLVTLLREKNFTVVPVLPTFQNYLKDGWYSFTSIKNLFHVELPQAPAASVDVKGRWTYTATVAIAPGRTESFMVLCFPLSGEQDALKDLSDYKLDFNLNASANSFSFKTKDNLKASGRILRGHSLGYILIHESRSKPKYAERFFQSFAILAE